MFVVCEKWVETETDCYIDPNSSLDHSSTSSASWLGLLNQGSVRVQSPQSAAGSHFGILSPTDSNRPGTWLYYFLTSTCFRCSSTYLLRCSRGSIYNICDQTSLCQHYKLCKLKGVRWELIYGKRWLAPLLPRADN